MVFIVKIHLDLSIHKKVLRKHKLYKKYQGVCSGLIKVRFFTWFVFVNFLVCF